MFKNIVLFLSFLLSVQVSNAYRLDTNTVLCRANMRDANDRIVDSYSVSTPYFEDSCRYALQNCNNILDNKIKYNLGDFSNWSCDAEWHDSLPNRTERQMSKNKCYVNIINIKSHKILKKFKGIYRGYKDFLNWMTACNKAMDTCMDYIDIRAKNIDCVREEYIK